MSTLFQQSLCEGEEEIKSTEESSSTTPKGEEATESGESGDQSTNGTGDQDNDIPRYDYVLVGGGVACYKAIQAIRENDKTGTILLVGGEDYFPYERSVITKGFWFREQEKIPKDLADRLSKPYDLGDGDSQELEKDYNVTFSRNVLVLRGWPDDRVLALSNHSLVR